MFVQVVVGGVDRMRLKKKLFGKKRIATLSEEWRRKYFELMEK